MAKASMNTLPNDDNELESLTPCLPKMYLEIGGINVGKISLLYATDQSGTQRLITKTSDLSKYDVINCIKLTQGLPYKDVNMLIQESDGQAVIRGDEPAWRFELQGKAFPTDPSDKFGSVEIKAG